MNKTLITACLATLGLLAGPAHAANADCEARASEKKLAGAAKSSFMKKCEKDAGAAAPGSAASPAASAAVNPACEKSAADKKLAGAAKTGHIKKCMADAAAAKK